LSNKNDAERKLAEARRATEDAIKGLRTTPHVAEVKQLVAIQVGLLRIYEHWYPENAPDWAELQGRLLAAMDREGFGP
jgi:hypothetical protein